MGSLIPLWFLKANFQLLYNSLHGGFQIKRMDWLAHILIFHMEFCDYSNSVITCKPLSQMMLSSYGEKQGVKIKTKQDYTMLILEFI